MPSPIAGGWLHAGGPDRPPHLLRDLLVRRIDAVPGGGEIVWAVRGIGDDVLADALIAAAGRGVSVSLHVDARATPIWADDVMARLSAGGLSPDIERHEAERPMDMKVHIFSHPEPSALIGSYDSIGEHSALRDPRRRLDDLDRGHDLLIEYSQPALVAALRDHARRFGGTLERLRPSQNRAAEVPRTSIFFHPRLRPRIVDAAIGDLDEDARLRVVLARHLPIADPLFDRLSEASARGVGVALIGDHLPAPLASAGARLLRRQPTQPPINMSFLLIEMPGAYVTWVGDIAPHGVHRDLLVRSTDPELFAALSERFDRIAAETATTA